MASSREIVGEYRSIVERVIETSQSSKPSGSIAVNDGFRNGVREVNKNGLRFSIFEPGCSVLAFGRRANDSETIWAMGPKDKINFRKYCGRLALVSYSNEPDRLFRYWDFDSALQIFGSSTQKPITEEDELQKVLDWAVSPHLYDANLRAQMELEDWETKYIDQLLDGHAQLARERHQDTEAMSRTGWRIPPNIGPIASA
mgnify:CR=1 FL=1